MAEKTDEYRRRKLFEDHDIPPPPFAITDVRYTARYGDWYAQDEAGVWHWWSGTSWKCAPMGPL